MAALPPPSLPPPPPPPGSPDPVGVPSIAPAIVALCGGAAVFIGSFLPWAKLGFVSAAGTDGDGIFTIILGLVLAFLAGYELVRRRGQLYIAMVVVALVASGVALYELVHVATSTLDFLGTRLDVRIGEGLWLVAIGALAALVGGVLGVRAGPAHRRATPPPGW
jgi:hypothetical protein